ncbi:MAG: hypothetical protein D6675_09080 [Gemmatimonadetes bacterium]|nr:MAG: hypothetical protein D6675_09080 [Gemmatimonadota bacterium]
MKLKEIFTAKDVIKIVIEIATIVFSVLLAFGINEWRQNQINQNNVKSVYGSIQYEIETNKQAIQDAFSYHETLIKAIYNGDHSREVAAFDLKNEPLDFNNEAHVTAFFAREVEIDDDYQLIKKSPEKYLIWFDYTMRGKITLENDTLKIYFPKGIQLQSAVVANNAWEIALATQATVHMDYNIVQKMAEIYKLQVLYESLNIESLKMLYQGNFKLPALEDITEFERMLLQKYDEMNVLLASHI